MHIAHLSFRPFSRPSRPFPPIFMPHLNLTCNDFNKCILSIFLSVTFSPFLTLFPPFFPPLSILFPPFFPPHLKLALPASTKCILPIFLSVTSPPAFFAPFPPFSPSYLNIVSHASNKCVLTSFFFRHFSRPSRAFPRPFSVAFSPLFPSILRHI
jgi:hypothetical protein